MHTLTRRAASAALLAVLVAGAAACGDDGGSSSSGNAGDGVSVVLADKGFDESAIVAQAYAAALRGQGFDVEVKSLASTEIADAAVRKGDIDAYPEYDGTTYLNVLKKDAAAAPADRAALFQQIVTGSAARGLTALPPALYNNGNEVACTKAAVFKYHITNLTALGKASPNLVYSANAEHLTRPDGLPLLKSAYGVAFKAVTTVDISLRYRPVQQGKAQCAYAFGTDPQISKLRLVLIKDDKGSFSGKIPFRSYPVVNTTWLDGLTPEAKAAFEASLAQVNTALTQEKIQDLNAQVTLDKEDPADVAQAFVDGLSGSGTTTS